MCAIIMAAYNLLVQQNQACRYGGAWLKCFDCTKGMGARTSKQR